MAIHGQVCTNSRGTIPTVFLYFIYRFRPPKMQKYVRTYQKNTPHSAAKLRPGQRLLCQINFRVSLFVAVGAPRHFISILKSSALAYTDSEMELTRTCCFGFDRKRRPGGKVSFLCHINVYFMVACFTHQSPHPLVDKPL